MSEPSIKGSIFAGVIEDLLKLRDSGRIPREKLEARLTPTELELIETKIYPGTWYPMLSYARVTDLLCEMQTSDRREYFRGRGAANARRLIEGGLYSQLDFLKRWDASTGTRAQADLSARLDAYIRSLRLVTTLSKSIYSTGDWRVERDPDRPGRARIEILDTAAYSEGMRLAIEGFLNECVRAVREHELQLYVSERVAPDHIRISMTKSLADFMRQ
jgi:hypothetical protein